MTNHEWLNSCKKQDITFILINRALSLKADWSDEQKFCSMFVIREKIWLNLSHNNECFIKLKLSLEVLCEYRYHVDIDSTNITWNGALPSICLQTMLNVIFPEILFFKKQMENKVKRTSKCH